MREILSFEQHQGSNTSLDDFLKPLRIILRRNLVDAAFLRKMQNYSKLERVLFEFSLFFLLCLSDKVGSGKRA